jgi:hypothetical protein
MAACGVHLVSDAACRTVITAAQRPGNPGVANARRGYVVCCHIRTHSLLALHTLIHGTAAVVSELREIGFRVRHASASLVFTAVRLSVDRHPLLSLCPQPYQILMSLCYAAQSTALVT